MAGGMIDQEARDMAYQAKELATRLAALQESHIAECDKRETRRDQDHRESTNLRHQMRNDMVAGFTELREMMSARTSRIYDRMWICGGALVTVLLSVIGALAAKLWG